MSIISVADIIYDCLYMKVVAILKRVSQELFEQ